MYSIIIPVYNKQDYIKRTINSVLKQTFSDFEIIVVDDGSTDRSMEILKEFKDDRIKMFSQVNSGVSAARNKGIKMAKHQYIAFIDADDTWGELFLEKITNLIRKFPSAGAYYTAYMMVRNGESIVPSKQEKIKEVLIDDYFYYALKGQTIWTASVVIKREVFYKIGGFPTNYKIGEDLYLWTKLALNYKIAHTNYIGAFYFINVKNSLTDIKVNKVSLNESFANDAESFFYKNKNTLTNNDNFREYMIRTILDKPKFLMKENNKKKARNILKKYSNTKYYKKKAFVLYVMSWFPTVVLKKIL